MSNYKFNTFMEPKRQAWGVAKAVQALNSIPRNNRENAQKARF